MSVSLALEYEAVCSRVEHQLAAGLSEREVSIFVNAAICHGGARGNPFFVATAELRDTGDEMVLEAAVNGRADALVTFNQRDFGNVPGRFGVELLLTREAIARIIR